MCHHNRAFGITEVWTNRLITLYLATSGIIFTLMLPIVFCHLDKCKMFCERRLFRGARSRFITKIAKISQYNMLPLSSQQPIIWMNISFT